MKLEPNKIKSPYESKLSLQKPTKSLSLSRIQLPTNPYKDLTFLAKKQQIQSYLWDHHIVQHNLQIQGLIKRYHASCIYYKIPTFYSYFFMRHLSAASESNIEEFLKKEINGMKQKSIRYFTINNAIQARQSCIRQTKNYLQILFSQGSQDSDLKSLTDKIQHFRNLTGLVIDLIKGWKTQLSSMSQEKQLIEYHYEGENYLWRLINDNNFISKSFLSANVKFSEKNDPFLIRPYKEGGTHEYVKLFQMNEQQSKRYLDYMNYLAEQKYKHIHKSQDQKYEKIKQIEDIYQSKTAQFNNNILFKKLKVVNSLNAENPISEVEEKVNLRLAQFNKKAERIEKIKSSFRSTLIVNPRKIQSNNQWQSTNNNQRIKSLNPKPIQINMSRLNQNTIDFDEIIKKKQLKLLEEKPIKIKQLKPLKQESPKKIIFQENIWKPKLNNFDVLPVKIKNTQRETSEKVIQQADKKMSLAENIIQQNQELMFQLRNKVIKQMQQQSLQENKLKNQRKQYDKKVEQYLKRKIEIQDLQQIKKKKQSLVVGKEQMASEFNAKSLFGYKQQNKSQITDIGDLNEQLKRQMRQKWIRDVQEELQRNKEHSNMIKHKKQETQKINKQYQQAMKRTQIQQKYKEIERQQRAKRKKQQIELDQKRKNQIQKQMRQVIEKEKQKMQKFATLQKLSLEQQIRGIMKAQLLDSLKQQKKKYLNEKAEEESLQKKERLYRIQMREKLERQYGVKERLEKIKKEKDKESKIKIINKKLDNIDFRMEEFKSHQMQMMKSKISDFSTVFVKNPIEESQKQKMRDQFQCQLFAFQKQSQSSQKQFYAKAFHSELNELEYITQRMNKIKQQQIANISNQDNQKTQIIPNSSENLVKANDRQQKYSQVSSNFRRFSEKDKDENIETVLNVQNKINDLSEQNRIRLKMSVEEYQIYEKKKSIINEIREIKQKQRIQTFLKKQQLSKSIEKFEIMKIQQSQKQQVKHQNQKQVQDIEASQVNSSQNYQLRPKIVIQNILNQDLHNTQTIRSKFSQSASPSKRFLTSGSQSEEDQKVYQNNKLKSTLYQKKILRMKQPNSKKIKRKQTIKKDTDSTNITKMKILREEKVEQFLEDQFGHLPSIIKQTLIYQKQLLKKLILLKKSIYIIETIKQNECLGLCIAILNQTKVSLRSIDIVHLGPYDEKDFQQLVQTSTQYIFKYDTCDQISFSIKFDKQKKIQSDFITEFQKFFNDYCSIFEKKIINSRFERKYVLRRMMGIQCKAKEVHNNLGVLKITNSLMASELLMEKEHLISSNSAKTSYFGILAIYLSKLQQETLNDFMNGDDTPKRLKYLVKTSKSIKESDVKFKEVQDTSYESPLDLNMQLMKEGRQLVKFDTKTVNLSNKIKYSEFRQSLQIKYNFIALNLKHQDRQYRYFRYRIQHQIKSYNVKSERFSSKVTILPCRNPNYKVFFLSSEQFDNLNFQTQNSLDVYMKVFFSTLSSHQHCQLENIYIPQFKYSQIIYIEEVALNENLFFKQNVDYSYTDYMENSLKSNPTHRDLLITAPFIYGVMNSKLERVSEGSPFYCKKVSKQDLINSNAHNDKN